MTAVKKILRLVPNCSRGQKKKKTSCVGLPVSQLVSIVRGNEVHRNFAKPKLPNFDGLKSIQMIPETKFKKNKFKVYTEYRDFWDILNRVYMQNQPECSFSCLHSE